LEDAKREDEEEDNARGSNGVTKPETSGEPSKGKKRKNGKRRRMGQTREKSWISSYRRKKGGLA